MHYLITGHTGFKGSWLTLLLKEMGHDVSGIALDPKENSLFKFGNLNQVLVNDIRLDIRNAHAINEAVQKIKPDVAIHLAAQPLVNYSYMYPIETFETNVIGTLNFLEAVKSSQTIKTALVITTDKVYKDTGKEKGYVENDPLGGNDPYSASKAAADISAQSWIQNFATFPIGIARAGNVIGGGDFAEGRIVTDLVKTSLAQEKVSLRYPYSVRPWQHVLDCLNGYLKAIDYQIKNQQSLILNFGPDLSQKTNVHAFVEIFQNFWGINTGWVETGDKQKETSYLMLDSSKARRLLDWTDKIDTEKAISITVNWFKSFTNNPNSAREITESQIKSIFQK